LRVLFVDDDADIRTIARITLGDVAGWNVTLVGSGQEAVATAARELPDVILLDFMMPGLDGPGTLERLRAQPATAGIPVIFVTAKTQKGETEAMRAMGARGIVQKPFDPMQLPAEVLRILGA